MKTMQEKVLSTKTFNIESENLTDFDIKNVLSSDFSSLLVIASFPAYQRLQ